MMMEGDLTSGLLFAVCLGFSFLFSGMESGIMALSRVRIRQWSKQGNSRATILNGFLERGEDFLWTVVVGNTLASVVAVGLMVTWLHRVLGIDTLGFYAAMGLFSFVFYAVCDLLPKLLFQAYPNRLCMMVAAPFRAVMLLLAPLVGLVRWIGDGLLKWSGGERFTGRSFASRDELRQVMRDSSESLSSEERAMIERVLDLETTPVGPHAKPLEKACGVPMEAPVSEVQRICRERDLTRLPVVRTVDGRVKVAGIISLKTFLYSANISMESPASDFLTPALFLHEDVKISVALKRMQQTGERMAIILDAERREVGFITLQDLLRLVFGEVNL